VIARAATLLLLAPLALSDAQRGEGGTRLSRALGDANEFWTPPDFRGNVRYDGRFTFMRSITSMRPFVEAGDRVGGVILALDDAELFRYPVAYLSEPGGWEPNDREVQGLRNYLLKGGFVIVDDFDGWSSAGDLMAFQRTMQRVLPDHRLVEVDGSHPIFDSFFRIDLSLLQRWQTPVYYAVFQDNDPKKRIMMIVNYNNDIGEWWQWSDRGFSPVPVSNEAYELGVNYLIYALTH